MSASFYRSAEWRRLRLAVLTRDPVCSTRGCDRKSTHCDHIVPRSAGGADNMANCRGVCTSCHNRRSASGNAPLRAVGCDATGRPLDPAHPWLAWGAQADATILRGDGHTPSEDGDLRDGDRWVSRSPSKKSGGR